MDNYPTLRLGVLHGLAALKASCDAEADFLRKRECPYDNDTVDLLERMFKPVEIEVIKEVFKERPTTSGQRGPKVKAGVGDDDAAELETEARQLLTDLRALSRETDGEMKQLDTATKLTIIKTQTSIMEKLVSIRERFSSVRKVAQFQGTVISILDDLVPEDNRDEFMKRLEPYRA